MNSPAKNVRINVTSGAPWEDPIGYSRAVQHGNFIHVAGTTAVDSDGKIVAPNNPYDQTRFILRKIRAALLTLGSDTSAVVRTRIYVTNIADWPEVARAHREVFNMVRPANTLIAVSAFVDPLLVVEIEADAVIRLEDGITQVLTMNSPRVMPD